MDEFPDVIHARRIHVRKGDVRIPTNTIVLTFDCPKPLTGLIAGYLTVSVRPYVSFPMRCFNCHKFGHGKDKCRRTNAVCGRCGKEHADQHQCTAAAHCINCKGDHPAFSKQCPKFLEEQVILRYRAEHGGTFKQARAAVIVETPRSVSSRTYAQALRPGQKPKETAQPKASDKVSASFTPKANAQRHTPPSKPKGAVSRPSDKPRARIPSKEGAPREPINRFGNVSEILLQLFNTIWLSGKIPSSWKEAIVLPIPKPNKDLSDPTNYRPIALTSCLCKTMERMVNDRLVWVLESKKLLSKFQCGFRKDHSTLDHLVRFEHFIREAFARKKQVLAVFFDLENAYDTTWKHGILTDVFDLEFRGRLPIFLQNFLSDRHFQVKSG